jgi:hypothetical protein
MRCIFLYKKLDDVLFFVYRMVFESQGFGFLAKKLFFNLFYFYPKHSKPYDNFFIALKNSKNNLKP